MAVVMKGTPLRLVWPLLLWSGLQPALAADLTPAAVSGQIDPGLGRERLERERQARDVEERARRIQMPALQGEAAPEQQLPEQDVQFSLRGISFNSSVFLPREQLNALAGEYVGRPIGFADLNALLRRINALYTERGQLTARAIVPPQELADGVLRVVLIEASVDQVQWKRAPKAVDEDFYRQRLEVEADKTLDSQALMTALQRFNSTTPGPQVSASLAPGQRFGTTRVDLEAYEPDPLQWSLFLNNYGNEGSGREQYGGSLTWFSPTGVADAFSLLLMASEASRYGSLRYSRPVNRYNGVVFVEGSANRLQIEEGPFAALNIEGNSSSYGIGYDQPWWLNERWQALGGVAYRQQASETTIEGVGLSETDIREMILKGQLEYRSQPWYLRYEQRVRQATLDNRISGDSGNYSLLGGDAYLMRSLPARFEAVGRFGWQYATDAANLPSSLYYQFGGISSVRGYDAGVISSPQGMTLNLEMHWRYSERWQPFVFFDYGRAMELGTADVDLQSVGVGLNFNWGRHFSASLVAANTLKDVVPDQDSGQLLAQFVLR
ncbi:ShlB/FhaC/HecB family hemolysin secretion/activation protein [Metapseudomonas otitidis]|uniref:ShlB/FhaC/HecB family hemolysin secretion/activation protein n=1 Tax=Metapseudomonas otitidis TaxID=319939 RepID=UPI0039FB8AC7